MKVVDKALYNDNSTATNQTLIYGENTNVYGSTMTDRKPLAYGRITITDLTNIGKLSAYLTSSQPLMVVYDPNSANEYMPNWKTNNLVITPVVFFNNDQITLTSEFLEIKWKRKAGSGEITDLITGENVVNGSLIVTDNMLSNIEEGILTYSCSIKYVDTLSDSSLQTQTQMTYSLVKNAPELVDCSILGDTTFKYDSTGKLVSAGSITLTTNLTNTKIVAWQYKNAKGEFVDYPQEITSDPVETTEESTSDVIADSPTETPIAATVSNILIVKATDDVFVDDIVTIKAVTEDPSVYDTHQIIKLRDGQQGAAGEGAVNVVLGNSSEIIPCSTSGTVVESKDIIIPFDCYKGINRVAGTASVGTLPSGVTVKTNTNATTTTSGTLVLAVAKGATLSFAESGDITITFTTSGVTSTHKFSWTKRIQAASGESAILLQIMVADNSSTVILNDGNNVILKAQLSSGTSVITSGITYQWSKFTGSAYENISNATGSQITVTPAMVDSVASFKCTATYNNKSYTAFYSVTDKTDPIEIRCFSTLGEQIINGSGVGAIYALVLRNGEELDAIKTTSFGAAYPSSPTSGTFFYKLDSTKKSVSLMKYNGTSWVEAVASEQPKAVYSWYRRDASGNELDKTKPYATGKAIYLDSTVVNRKINFTCKCEIN